MTIEANLQSGEARNTGCEGLRRILVVEPTGSHKALDAFFLRSLEAIGKVTFAAPEGFLDTVTVHCRQDIPSSLLRHRTKLGARISAIRVLNHILRENRLEDFAAVIFLSYETISFTLRWPRKRPVYLFEHNNLSNANGSLIKSFFYRMLPRRAESFAFQKHILGHIRSLSRRRAVFVPHPILWPAGSGSEGQSGPLSGTGRGGAKIIFSPSGSTPEAIQAELRAFASGSEGSFFAICKGRAGARTGSFEIRPYFDNYVEVMRSCDMVFVGGKFDFRVSGVAYEALGLGKPVVIMDSMFARELAAEYPNMVRPIAGLDEIRDLDFQPEEMAKEHARFQEAHSPSVIVNIVEEFIRSGNQGLPQTRTDIERRDMQSARNAS